MQHDLLDASCQVAGITTPRSANVKLQPPVAPFAGHLKPNTTEPYKVVTSLYPRGRGTIYITSEKVEADCGEVRWSWIKRSGE